MEPDKLAYLLQIGLGRALVQIKQHYDVAYRETILNACLHNLAYDRQVEGSRARYMLEIVDATNDYDFYRSAILENVAQLSTDDDDYDIQQVINLMGWLAERGDTEARAAVFSKFNASPTLGDLGVAEEIIALDGASGFTYVVERLVNHHTEVDNRLWHALLHHIDEAEATALAENLRTNNPSVIPVFDEIDRWRQPRKRKPQPKIPLPYHEVKRLIREPEGVRFNYFQWGQQATPADLRRAAEDLLKENEPGRLFHYLQIFWNRPFPLNPLPLFDLANHQNERVAIYAVKALESIDKSTVRTFALDNIEKQYLTGLMATFLKGKYHQAEDWSLIEKLTLRDLDRKDYHSLGFSVFHVFDLHPSMAALPALQNLYEQGPCSACRERVVERLATLRAIPVWMREECLHDSNFDLRERMRSGFNTSTY